MPKATFDGAQTLLAIFYTQTVEHRENHRAIFCQAWRKSFATVKQLHTPCFISHDACTKFHRENALLHKVCTHDMLLNKVFC
jgi:hypothetical protein